MGCSETHQKNTFDSRQVTSLPFDPVVAIPGLLQIMNGGERSTIRSFVITNKIMKVHH